MSASELGGMLLSEMPSSLNIWCRCQRIYLRLRAGEQRAFDAWNRRVDQRISLTVGSVLLVLGAGSVTKPVHARIEFYAVVAQILPVLLLVGAVDARYFRERDDAPPLDRFLIRGFWIVGLIGLGASLAAIALGHDSVILRGLVIYALVLVGVLVTVYAIHGPARDRSVANDAGEPGISNQPTGPSDLRD